MKYPLFAQVTLAKDFPAKGLRQGDIATVVEHHPVLDGEDGYSLEVFNALGETITVLTAAESEIRSLSANDILHIRSFAVAS